MRRSHQGIDVEHLLVGVVGADPTDLTGPILEQSGVSPNFRQTNATEQALEKIPQVQGSGAAPGQVHYHLLV